MSAEQAAFAASVRAYIEDDPDESCRDELTALLAADDFAALHERFATPLQFGTAGLRGAMGAGPGRIHRAGIARATAGLCAHLRASVADASRRGLCIGFDARHHSRAFAAEAAAVAAGAGFVVHLAQEPIPTPLLAFSVIALRAAGGVMVTASHNPARDNGFKVYLDDGVQIVAPQDAAIAAEMAAVASLRALPRVAAADRRERGLEHAMGAELQARYLAAIEAELGAPNRAEAGALRIAYTAMHGVGEHVARTLLTGAGFVDFHSVPEQAEPDPDFPTVAFPNPEEPGALDRVLALGTQLGAHIAIANDPDADRLALAAHDATGTLRALSGNQVGALLAEHLLHSGRHTRPALVVASVVSSPLIAAIAKAHGARFEATLTGFKWICSRALQLEREQGLQLVLGTEEALGYAIGQSVRDKDGLCAALAAATLAAELHARGQSLFDLLDALYRTHGAHLSRQISLRLQGPSASAASAIMSRLRSAPPSALAGLAVERVIDLQAPVDEYAALPPSDLLFLQLQGGQRVAFRPSGTEPKLKVYLDVIEPVAAGESVRAAEARAQTTLDRLAHAVATLLSAA